MSKKIALLAMAIFCILAVLPVSGYAFELLTKEKALEEVFGSGIEISAEARQITAEKAAVIKERLSKDLGSYPAGTKIELPGSVEIYSAGRGAKKEKFALILDEQGKWGPVKFIVVLDQAGVVARVEILEYSEKRGQPIARHSFLSQFEGKTSKSPMQIGKDIFGISGATVSSKCAARAVKKAIVLYEEAYLK